VILNQSMQEVKKVDELVHEALRVGRRVIVGFPNFAYFRARLMLFFRGKSPITPSLPYRWFDTPNVRFLSIADFRDFCREKGLLIQEAHYLGERREINRFANLLALNAIFLIAMEEENVDEFGSRETKQTSLVQER
jgi:methionine biosynthesis protein MetW